MGIDIFIQMKFQFLGQEDFKLCVLIQYFTLPVLATAIILVYLSIGLKSTGKPRKLAFLMTLAIISFGCGEMSNTRAAVVILPWVVIAAPIFMISSLILIFIAVSNLYKEEK